MNLLCLCEQLSSSINHDARELSFHSDVMPPVDDRRYGSRYRGDRATPARDGVIWRLADHLLDIDTDLSVSLRTEHTRCKQVDCSC